MNNATSTTETPPLTPFVRELTPCDPVALFSTYEHLPYSLLLDSADTKHEDARYTFVLSHPIETIEVKDNTITLVNWDGATQIEGDPFEILQSRITHWRGKTQHIEGLPPFQGGAAGLFGYDLGRSIEKLPSYARANPNMPDMAVGIYDTVIAFDHKHDKLWMITHADTQDIAIQKQDYILSIAEDADITRPEKDTDLKWNANFTKDNYKRIIEKTIEYIQQGDIFQANIAQRFDAVLPEDFSPFGHYLRLRQTNPAPFASYFNLGDIQISSASPERFLSCDHTGHVETKPIKGTRPISTIPTKDESIKAELQNSKKDRAENTMIVDLLRNDLSKCCEAASVRVEKLCALESFASVHHLVSTISAQLRSDQTAIALLRACFPGGSITGAPKIRAMEIIDALEPTRRGPYCGSIGYIGFDGSMDTNILIRTLVFEGNHVSLQSGGGIVIGSDPLTEYQETLHKAKAMLASFDSTPAKNTTKKQGSQA